MNHKMHVLKSQWQILLTPKEEISSFECLVHLLEVNHKELIWKELRVNMYGSACTVDHQYSGLKMELN